MRLLSQLIAIMFMILPVVAAGANDYRDAKPSKVVFDQDDLGLMGIEREKLATELAAYVSNELGRGRAAEGREASERTNLANRMIGVALQLHPRNRTALITNFKMVRGVPTDFATADYEPDVLAEYLYTRSKLLLEQGGGTNELLAGYLLSFAVEIDPTNEDAIYDLEVRSVDGKAPNWALISPWMPPAEKGGAASTEGEGPAPGAPTPVTSNPGTSGDKKPVPPPRFGGWPLDDGKGGLGPLISD